MCAIVGYTQQVEPIQTIKGKVIQQGTGTAVAFASVFLKAGKNGISTDENGYFMLTVKSLPDTLLVSEIGFETRTLVILRATSDTLTVELAAITNQLQEVTVTAYKDPGKALMKMAIARKKTNDPARLKIDT